VDAGLVRLELHSFLGGRGFGESHLADVELLLGVEAEFQANFGERVWLAGFVVEMPLGEGAVGLGELFVIRRFLGQRGARQHRLEVLGKVAVIVCGMQDATDVVEEVVLAHLFCGFLAWSDHGHLTRYLLSPAY
jgi:hypothetical protein